MALDKTSLSYRIGLFLNGIAMGAANKVPGVSGGAVAFILGFYQELIYSFQKVNIKAFRLLIGGRLTSFYQYINGKFLLLVMGGSVFSYFTVSKLLDYLLVHYELYVWSLFFGMIIGSVYYIAKNFENWNYKTFVNTFLGALMGLSITFLEPAKENTDLWFVFLCGIIGVSGMTIPGLSGSFILMLIGNYVLLLVDSVNVLNHVLSRMFLGDFSVFQNPINQQYLRIIGVFTAGSLFGLVSLSQLLAFVLRKWNDIVITAIIGFIIGSLGTVWPWKHKIYVMKDQAYVLDELGHKIIMNYKRYLPSLLEKETWIALFIMVVGVVFVASIESIGKFAKK